MSGSKRALVTGAAGFIGSHLVDRLLGQGFEVVGIDNFVRGQKCNLETAESNRDFTFIEHDLTDSAGCLEKLRAAGANRFDIVWHMAANSDIAAGVADPNVDLRDTFMTTFHTLAIIKELGTPQLVFASSSAVYGPVPGALREDTGPLFPISNYGAMKLGGEGMISAALETYLEKAWIFRFPNVVGDRATHGVIYDLINKLKRDRAELEVLGNGKQCKPYLHVSELIDAMCLAVDKSQETLNCFNVSGTSDLTEVRYIAEQVIKRVSDTTPIRYTGGEKGWAGDVPRFEYDTGKIQTLGWTPKLNSHQAVDRAVDEIAKELSA